MKRLKKWLPVLCATLLLCCSSLNVNAATESYTFDIDGVSYTLDYSISELIDLFKEKATNVDTSSIDSSYKYITIRRYYEADYYDAIRVFLSDDVFYLNNDNDSLGSYGSSIYLTFECRDGSVTYLGYGQSVLSASKNLDGYSDIYVTNYDMYDSDGNLVFYNLLSQVRLPRIARQVPMTGVLNPILQMIPTAIACLVGYLGLRKALGILLNLLHRA